MVASPYLQPMVVGETNANANTNPTSRTYASAISRTNNLVRNLSNQSFFLYGEPTVVLDFKDLVSYIMEDNLQFASIAKFSHGRPELLELQKILLQQLGFKGECNIMLLESRHVLM
ncbi:hypothetical protein RND71_038342 [Anisodus tanguticus]|uniref:Uncharacterized protein n=1 Tax=Anisodus tanguticus TaxID=243964 RepID=A0AAE1R087_9SOLA|nr:hypothetical protein RND71_038342 [Anisodus tanguticus]